MVFTSMHRHDSTYQQASLSVEMERTIMNAPALNEYKQYSIYILTDPLDKQVRYVGRSSSPEKRYKQHLQCRENNPQKNAWIQSLLSNRLRPIMTIIERVEDSRIAHRREAFWIQIYLGRKAPLTNLIADELIEDVKKDLIQEGIKMLARTDAQIAQLENDRKRIQANIERLERSIRS